MIKNDSQVLPDLFDLLIHWWKKILLIVLIITIIVTVILIIKPKEYLGVTTALPASEFATDKGGIFNENIQVLYPSLGTPDALDVVVGTAKLDTLYAILVDEFDLVNNYGLSGKKNGRYNAIKKLKDDTRVIKSDYGELKVKIWHRSPLMASNLSRAFMQQLQIMHQQVQLANNKKILENIQRDYKNKLGELSTLTKNDDKVSGDSSNLQHSVMAITLRTEALVKQIAEYGNLMNQYNMVITANPDVLVVVENAPVPVKHDRPDYLLTLIATIFTSFVFAFLAVLIFEKRRALK